MVSSTRRQFIGAAGISGATVLAGCLGASGSTSSNGDTTAGQETATAASESDTPTSSQYIDKGAGIAILSWEWQQSDYTTSLTGLAKNTTDSTFEYAQIEFSFVGAQNTQLATGLANTNNLGGGQRWQWSTPYTGDDARQVDAISLDFSSA